VKQVMGMGFLYEQRGKKSYVPRALDLFTASRNYELPYVHLIGIFTPICLD
jgi:hypothetical protein